MNIKLILIEILLILGLHSILYNTYTLIISAPIRTPEQWIYTPIFDFLSGDEVARIIMVMSIITVVLFVHVPITSREAKND